MYQGHQVDPLTPIPRRGRKTKRGYPISTSQVGVHGTAGNVDHTVLRGEEKKSHDASVRIANRR